MAEQGSKSRLGRGLAALIGDDVAVELGDGDAGAMSGLRAVPIEHLRANPFQPRNIFDEDELTELTESIRAKGILQPIVVRRVADTPDAFEIVAGERRWRAAQRAQLHQVPILIKELSDAESLEIAIIENVQRADLNSIEEAAGYERLVQQFDYTQEQLSGMIGKSRSHVANTLRLLTLPESVQAMIADGQLTAGHARSLVGVPDAEKLARDIVARGLNVREAEALTRKPPRGPAAGGGGGAAQKDADTRALERNISDSLGLNVDIVHRGEKGGQVRIHYKTLEQLDEICRRLAQARGPIA